MDKSFESMTEKLGSACPMHHNPIQQHSLDADDELVFPMHKRVIVQYSKDYAGSPELHLYYGDKEISFDDPELFEFGENLAKQSRFVAKTATEWSHCYDWPRIQELLEQLIDEGILHYANTYIETPATGQQSVRSSPIPPAFASVPHTWLECDSITSALADRPLEIGYLELIVPIFRVAHIAMDSEGRQVGEANVFPKALRLDVPTEWRTCPYPGSRYLDQRPMNITAMKSMRTYWPQMMTALLQIRNAYLQRYPSAQHEWTIADLEALSTLVLAVPTYLLMRNRKRVPNGELHPALSSMFRVTDGLRLTMHQMIFVPFYEPTRSPNAPMTSAEIYEYAERNYSFSSDHGVCAGPKAMIEEFLHVIVDGIPIKGAESVLLDEQVHAALEDLNPALDYGLYGLQAFAVVFSMWPVMTRTYEQLWTIVDAWSGDRTDTLIRFQERLQIQMNILKTETYHATEEWRVEREHAYSDIYRHCAMGLGVTPDSKTLTEQIAPVMETRHKRAFKQLRTILQQQCGFSDASRSQDADNLLTCLMNYFLQVQAILRLASEVQQSINSLLGRVTPLRPFDSTDINIHNLIRGDAEKRLSYLIDELEEIFDIRITITKEHIVFIKR
jgi:hypothetical protein